MNQTNQPRVSYMHLLLLPLIGGFLFIGEKMFSQIRSYGFFNLRPPHIFIYVMIILIFLGLVYGVDRLHNYIQKRKKQKNRS